MSEQAENDGLDSPVPDHHQGDKAPRLSDEDDPWDRDYFDRIHREEIEETVRRELDPKIRTEIQKEIDQSAVRRSNVQNYFVFLVGIAVLGGLAYFFRSSYLAAVPLLAIALLVVLWLPFQKFSQLQRVEAEFGTNGMRVGASSQDKMAELLSELQQKKIQLEIEATEKNIALLEVQTQKEREKDKRMHRLGPGE